MKINNKLFVLSSVLLAAAAVKSSHAAVIAIVDSGTDVTHPELASKIWQNPGEWDNGVDNDHDGYVNDEHGWDFVNNDDKLIDTKLIGTWPQDDYTYFQYQTAYLEGTATADQITWLKTKVADSNFIAQLEQFGDFVHGTHVAGCAAKDAPMAKLMILKVIGSPTPLTIWNGFMQYQDIDALNAMDDSGSGTISPTKDALIKAGLTYLGQAQGQALAAPGKYIAMKSAQVASCSFGAGRAEVEPTVQKLVEGILKTTLTQAQLDAYTDYFMQAATKSMQQQFIGPAAGTMFVIAAGNDGTDNDTIPAAPANVKQVNTITVAASLGRTSLATFSNFGATMVDVAAPGVGIRSTVPGGLYMEISGTSQATPYVTNIVGQVIDANPKLTLAEIKQIVLQTVDKKDWLAGKVVSGGIANPDRALYAANLSATMDVTSAIAKAQSSVADIPAGANEAQMVGKEGTFFVQKLPNFFHN